MNKEQQKTQEQIRKVRKSLPALTDAQKRFMNERVMFPNHKVYHTASGNCWCSHCGHAFKADKDSLTSVMVCPECGHAFSAEKSRRTTANGFGYSALIQQVRGWQVVRYFCTEYFAKKERKTNYRHVEVLRKWYNPLTKQTATERAYTRFGASWQDQPYSSWGTLYFAKEEDSYYASEWFKCAVYPQMNINPFFVKKGITKQAILMGRIDEIGATIALVDSIPYVQSLLEQGKDKELYGFVSHYKTALKFKEQIRIAVKHGFKFDEHNLRRVNDYFEYLRELKTLRRDMHSPKYLVPKDFYKEHAKTSALMYEKLEDMRMAKIARQEMRRLEQDKKAFEEFGKKVERYKNLAICGEGIEIRPLLSIDEFKAEGEAMHHCVFSMGYYKKSNCLILSARIDGKRVETIELDLKSWKIVQSRGVCNKITPQHDTIVGLMNKNMGKIKKLSKSKVKVAC